MNQIIVLSAVVMLVLLFMKVPVFVSILAGASVYFIANPEVNDIIFAQRMISSNQSTTFLAVPFFAAAGALMNCTGVTRRIMDFCKTITGRMCGGLAQVNVLLSTLMGGLSGSNIADAAMEAKLLVPEMERAGYSKPFSSVLTATSAIITPLIPPGIAMILYGCIAQVSIGKMFVAGIGVGLLLCLALMILVHFLSKKRGYLPIREERLSKEELWKAAKPALLPLMLPILIIGGIRIGVFTASEAGAVAICYAMVLGFVYKEMDRRQFVEAVKDTCVSTGSIMLIVGAASVYAWVLTKEQIPQALTNWIVGAIDSKVLFLLIINVFLLVLGMFIEGTASMIVLVPLLAPVARAYGIDDIQFAMIYIFNSAIGALSPPMGTLMFVTCGITKCKTKDFIKEAIPFYLLLIICLLTITFVPFVSTGLVNLLY
ncbi:MAG: TRAP transporter large permease [Lachnospiraceae bacterium]|nr:TRAP transporter large permease [Lachnospiraceae bacterium]